MLVLTQAQWRRLAPLDIDPAPSRYRGDDARRRYGVDATHPVENVDLLQAVATLRVHGLRLPSGDEWEHAARAGSDTPWWTGRDHRTLLCAANLPDQTALVADVAWDTALEDWPELDDTFAIHAPVDALLPNPWGLVHVHGNVWEWCMPSDHPAWDLTRELPASSTAWGDRMTSVGGGYLSRLKYCRSAYRMRVPGAYHERSQGLRAARSIDG